PMDDQNGTLAIAANKIAMNERGSRRPPPSPGIHRPENHTSNGPRAIAMRLPAATAAQPPAPASSAWLVAPTAAPIATPMGRTTSTTTSFRHLRIFNTTRYEIAALA